MKLALACANDPTADVEFYLVKQGDTIQLLGRKPNGFGTFSILGISKDGVLSRYAFVGSLGLQIDEYQKIKDV